MREMLFHSLSERIIGAAIEVHRELGPGLLESAYDTCLAHELQSAGIAHRRQVHLPVHYKTVRLDCAYVMDLVVEDSVVVEVKCAERILPIHEAQLLTYLRLSQKPLGLLINFNVPVLREGIRRRALTLKPFPITDSPQNA